MDTMKTTDKWAKPEKQKASVKIQIMVTERQAEAVYAMAAKKQISVSRLFRDSVGIT